MSFAGWSNESSSLRVLHVLPSVATRYGGPAVNVIGSALGTRAHGVESVVFATDMPGAPSKWTRRSVTPDELPDRAGEVDVHLFPTREPRRLAYSPALRRGLAAAVPHFDLVHIYSLFLFPQFAGYRTAEKWRVPYIVTPCGALDPFLRRRGRLRKYLTDVLWQRRMLEGAAAIHVTTEDEKRLIRDVAPDVPRVLVPHGIDLAEFSELPDPSAFRRTRLHGHTGAVVMFLGRITFKKGIDLLIRAFREVAAVQPEALLAIVGPDDEGLRPRLERLVEELGLSRRVVFCGMVAARERLEALAAADVWVLSSHSENFGVAVLEALAASRCVVTSPAVNLAPMIEQAGAGVIVPQDESAIAQAVVDLLQAPERRAEFGTRAREFARRFDRDLVARELADAYWSISEVTRTTGPPDLRLTAAS
jgi:glycosyltransferase involved in cell wall biosynthesis